MSLQFPIVHEAHADFLTASDLADRVITEAIDWLEPELLDGQRIWHQTTPAGEPLTWKRLKLLARDAGVEDRGFFEGQPAYPDAVAARRAILFLRTAFARIDAIVLVRDQDDQPDRHRGLKQARDERRHDMSVVIGFAVVEREAWVISGFEPRNQGEQVKLDAERQALGLNPCERSHELTACKDNTALRSPKRVLHALTGGDDDRERDCWVATPLARLRARGTGNGLVRYLEEVRNRLASLVGHVERGAG